MKLKKRIPEPAYKAWRRAWGAEWIDQEIRLMRVKRLPWRMACWVVGHTWKDKSPSLMCGPLGVPPRERDYRVLAFNRQCSRCYDVTSVPYTIHEKLAAIEEAIREDEYEWPYMKRHFSEETS